MKSVYDGGSMRTGCPGLCFLVTRRMGSTLVCFHWQSCMQNGRNLFWLLCIWGPCMHDLTSALGGWQVHGKIWHSDLCGLLLSIDVCVGALLCSDSKTSWIPGGGYGGSEVPKRLNGMKPSTTYKLRVRQWLNGKQAASTSLPKVIDKEEAFNFYFFGTSPKASGWISCSRARRRD